MKINQIKISKGQNTLEDYTMLHYLGKCLDYITVKLLLEKSLEGLTMRLKLHYTSLTSRHDKHIY